MTSCTSWLVHLRSSVIQEEGRCSFSSCLTLCKGTKRNLNKVWTYFRFMMIYPMLLHSQKKKKNRVVQPVFTLPQHRASLSDLRDILLSHQSVFLLLLPPIQSSCTHSFLPLQCLGFFSITSSSTLPLPSVL